MGTRSESGKPLSQGERRTLDALASLALVNGEDLARIQNRNASGVHASLRGLQKRGLIESVQLGCLLPQTERWLLTDLGQLALGLQDSSWHQPGCRQRLLERIAAVEWIFQAAGHLQEFGQFHEWTWVDGAGFDAAARSERGWVCFMWAGPLRIEARIRELVEQVGEDLESLAVDHPRPRPSLICCLVWDAFQVEIVLGVARRYRMEDWVRVWCVADDTWHGATGHLDGRGWVFQPAYRRNVGPEAWEARMQESPWSRMNNMDPKRNLTLALRAIKSARSGDKSVELAAAAIRTVTATEDAEGKMHAIESLMEGVKLYVNAQCQCGHKGGVSDSKTCGIHDAAEILGRAVAQIRRPVGTRDVARALYAPAEWPGITVSFMRALLREPLNGRRAQRTLMRLADLRLLARWKTGKVWRYRLTWAGMNLVADLDRASAKVMWRRIQMDRWDTKGGFTTHEYGVISLATQFAAAGCPVANGWRAWEDMGERGAIAPDAMVYLRYSPFGPGWHYIEYERSKKAANQIAKKLKGFDSPVRQNRWPVLMVCADDRAERNVHDWAIQKGVRIATTTVQRLKKYPAVGNMECWNYLGRSARLG